MKNKRFWLGMLVLTLVFGMTVIGCNTDDNGDDDENDNEPKEPIVINAPENGTLFSSVGSYAGKTPFTYNGKQWWVVAHWEYNWDGIGSEWDEVKAHNGTTQELSYHTRVGYQFPKTVKNYKNLIITYDMIFIGGDNQEILIRNSSSGAGGSDANLQPPSIRLEEGNSKTLSLPVSAFYNNPAPREDGWIAFSKSNWDTTNSAGAMLVRITSIKFING